MGTDLGDADHTTSPILATRCTTSGLSSAGQLRRYLRQLPEQPLLRRRDGFMLQAPHPGVRAMPCDELDRLWGRRRVALPRLVGRMMYPGYSVNYSILSI